MTRVSGIRLLHTVARGVHHGGMPHMTPDPSEGGVTSLSLADFIRNRRVELDITKSEAARRAGVSRRTWHEVEEGIRITSTAVTLAQFDQALQLLPGTLFSLTTRSVNRQAESLRQRAHDLVRAMTTDELEYFISHRGTETVPQLLRELTEEHRRLTREVERLRLFVLPDAVSEKNPDDTRIAVVTETTATQRSIAIERIDHGDRIFPGRSVDRGADRGDTV
jgi:transcriptional regulator with XRE-family HTH domain